MSYCPKFLELSLKLCEIANIDEGFQAVSEFAINILGFDYVMLLLDDRMTNLQSGYYTFDERGLNLPQSEKVRARQLLYFGMLEKNVLLNKKAKVIPDVMEKSKYFHPAGLNYLKAIIISPLYTANRNLGVIYFGKNETTHFDEEAVTNTTILSRLYSQHLDRIFSADEYKALLNISNNLNSFYDINSLANYMHDMIDTVYPKSRVFIVLNESTESEFYVYKKIIFKRILASDTKNLPLIRNAEFQEYFKDKNYFIWSGNTKHIFPKEKVLFAIFNLELLRKYFRNAMIVPIKTEAKCYGYFFIFDTRGKLFYGSNAKSILPVCSQLCSILERIDREKQSKDDTRKALQITVAQAAHKIGVPLNVLENDIKLARDNGNLDLGEFLNELTKDCKKIKTVFIKFKRFKPELTSPLNRQEVNVSSFLQTCFDRKILQERKNVRFSQNIDKSIEGLNINIDIALFRIAFNQLLRNAVNYNIMKGYIIFDASVIEDNGILFLCFLFKNQAKNGMGISSIDKQQIFIPFFTTGGNDGMGLGLSEVKDIVEAHYGTISEIGPPEVEVIMKLKFPLNRLTERIERNETN